MTKFKYFIQRTDRVLDIILQPILAGFVGYSSFYLYTVAKVESNNLLYLVGFSCLVAAIIFLDKFVKNIVKFITPLIGKLIEKNRR